MLAARVIKTFNDGAIQILQGKYGPYITDGVKNGKILKGMEALDLSLEDCLVALEIAPKGKPKSSAAAAKSATERAKRDIKASRGKSATVKTAKKTVGKTATAKTKPASDATAVVAKKPAAKKVAAKKVGAKKTTVKKAVAKKKVES